MPDVFDFESAAIAAGEHEYGYVKGHDGLLHCANRLGYIVCGMGRQMSPVYVIEGPVTCLRCYLYPWRIW